MASYLDTKYSTALQRQALADDMDAFLSLFETPDEAMQSRKKLLCDKAPAGPATFTIALTRLNFREGLHQTQHL